MRRFGNGAASLVNTMRTSSVAAVRSLQHFTWKDKDGTPQEGTFRVTDIFHKVGGKWKLLHTHVSVPVDPATGKGQMNLQS